MGIWPPQQPPLNGGNPALFTPLTNVEVKIQNTGKVASAEVVQLYVGIPGDDVPSRQLRGFSKPYLEPGQTKTTQFDLTRRDLSTWNVEKQDWELRRGPYKIYVGSSVLDIKLQGIFTLGDSGPIVMDKVVSWNTTEGI
jgi:beta-glucosidase